MGTYTPEEMLMPTGLDNLGLKYSMERLSNEPLSNYRQRLLLEARDPSDPSQDSTVRNVNRKVGEFELLIGQITLRLDVNGDPLASDPYVEITSNWIRLYYDYSAGSAGLDFECEFNDKIWMTDIVAMFSSSTYFDVTTFDVYDDYHKTSNLRMGNSSKWQNGKVLQTSYMNSLDHENIDQITFSNSLVFQEEKANRGDVTEPGDYWVDYRNGVIISNDVQSENVYYSYRDFPYALYYQPVAITFLNDKDIDYTLKDKLVSDDSGELEPALLNHSGTELLNKVLAAHPLGWGK